MRALNKISKQKQDIVFLLPAYSNWYQTNKTILYSLDDATYDEIRKSSTKIFKHNLTVNSNTEIVRKKFSQKTF